MSSPTKKIISDSILYELAGGYPPPSFPIKELDIWNATENKLNELFKLHYFDRTLANGETIPEAACIATYEGIAVTSLPNGKSKATLPITPLSLPKNMGVYLIYDPNNPDNPFIPLQRGQLALLKADAILNDLIGNIAYEVKNQTVIFTRDLTQFGITEVTMELCVFEMDSYGVNDPLTIPSDYVDDVEDELLKEFSIVLAKTSIDSAYTNPTQTPSK